MLRPDKFVTSAIYVVGFIIGILSIVCLSFLEGYYGWIIKPSIANIVEKIFPLKYSEYELFGILKILVGSIFVFIFLIIAKILFRIWQEKFPRHSK